jgi:hypothetical protein
MSTRQAVASYRLVGFGAILLTLAAVACSDAFGPSRVVLDSPSMGIETSPYDGIDTSPRRP